MHVLVVQPQLDKVVTDAEGAGPGAGSSRKPRPTIRSSIWRPMRELPARIAEADVVAGYVAPEALAQASPRLKWVHLLGGGAGQAALRRVQDQRHHPHLLQGQWRGAARRACASCSMLMLQRDAVRWLDEQRQKVWRHRPHEELAGKTCAIIGTGYSGVDLALKAKAFHMDVIGNAPQRRAGGAFRPDVPARAAARVPGRSGFRGGHGAAHAGDAGHARGGGVRGDEAERLLCLLLAWRHCRRCGAARCDRVRARSPGPGSMRMARSRCRRTARSRKRPTRSSRRTMARPRRARTSAGSEMLIENLRRYRTGEPMVNLVEKSAGY